MNLIFYNNFHNGDIHYSRQFIKDIIKKTNFNKYFYNHQNNNTLLKDIQIEFLQGKKYYDNSFNQKQIFIDEDNVVVNTWIGQSNAKYLKKTSKSCSLYSNYELFKDIYKYLKIKIEKTEYYIPTIKWKYINITNVDNYIKNNNNKRILISNGKVLSGQSPQFNMDYIIKSLSNDFPNIDFIITDNTNIKSKNIIYTGDIIKQNDSDLNEISYLSKYCDIVVGRASGPFAFCHIKENFENENKTFISFTNNRYDSNWYEEVKCKQIWSDDYSNIYNQIKKELILL